MPTPVIAFQDNSNFTDPVIKSINVGSAENRAAFVLVGRVNNTTNSAVSVTVGSDTLTAQGSEFVDPDGYRWRLFAGFLTVTGTQTVTVDYTTANGAAQVLGMVLQDVAAGLISGLVYGASPGISTTPSYTVASNTNASVYAMFVDTGGGSRPLTPSAPATALTGTGIGGTTGFHILQEVGTSSVVIDGVFGGSATWRGVGFSVPNAAVPSDLNGSATLDVFGASGTMAASGSSDLSGGAIVDVFASSGAMGLAPGTLTTPVLKNNTGTILASVTGIVANIYHQTTGALIVRVTGLSSNGSGIVTITDAAIAAGTTYAYELDLSASSQGRRLPTGVAA